MRGDQWRPLAAFALVTVLCAVLMVVSATGGFGLDLFRPGKPIVAPRASQPAAARTTPEAPAPATMPPELSALPLAAMAAGGTAPLLAPSAAARAVRGDAAAATGTDPDDAAVEVATTVASDPATTVDDATEARDEEKAQREAEREAAMAARDEEKAQREAEREAAKAARDEEKAQREAEREAAKAARDEEKAQREAERGSGEPHGD